MISADTLVSVIVPVYGTEAYLPACIDSIRKQTYVNIEIILVDDQSPDNCPAICDIYSHEDSRIKVVHQVNQGVSGARNTGLNMATGEYIMFVDSDDELYSNSVDMLLRTAIKHGADIVSASKRIDDKSKDTLSNDEDERCEIFRGHQNLLRSLQGVQNTNEVWAKLFRADFIRDVRFDVGKNINEDGYFLFQCFLKEPILVHRHAEVYIYNTRQGSSSRQTFSEKYLSMLYFCECKKELITTHYPQYMEQAYNMEVRTNLQLLDVLCSTTDRKYKALQRQCVNTVRKFYKYHQPVSMHHRLQAQIVVNGLYPLYKWAVRMKYYRQIIET